MRLLLVIGLCGCATPALPSREGLAPVIDTPEAGVAAAAEVEGGFLSVRALAESRGEHHLLGIETSVHEDADFDGRPDALVWSQSRDQLAPALVIGQQGEVDLDGTARPAWRLRLASRVQLDDGRWLEGDVPVVPPGPQLPAGAETLTIFGEPRGSIPQTEEARAEAEAALAAARAQAAARPDDALAQIWVGRRLGYLGRFREAFDVFSQVVERFPQDPRGWRFRGHRAITLRRFDQAVADLTQAAVLVRGKPDEVEPAGQPNERGLDLDTLQLNIHYHLALARHLRGEHQAALDHWANCLALARNDDGRAMSTYWMCVALTALDRHADCAEWLEAISEDMDIVEYHAYHQLCLAWKGGPDPLEQVELGGVDEATLAYGMGVLHLARGEKEQGLACLRLAASSPQWHAFGSLAAETELWRRGWTR